MDLSVQNIPLFKGCEEGFLKNLTAGARINKHEKGKILFIHGEKAKRFYYIKNGWVKLFRETLDGAQAIIDILPHGHIFGETSIFEDDYYPYSAEIAEPAEIVSFPLHDLKTEIEKNNKLALGMLNSMARYRRQQDKELEHRTLQSAPQRIGCFLLRLANQNKTGPATIHLPYDKMLVSAGLGMQPETFSRALAKLRDQTGMRVKGATIEIDNIDRLVHYSCSACSCEFPCKDLKTAE